jgi:hypothetical protein
MVGKKQGVVPNQTEIYKTFCSDHIFSSSLSKSLAPTETIQKQVIPRSESLCLKKAEDK